MASLPTNTRPIRDRTKWRENMDKIINDDKENKEKINNANKGFTEKTNTLRLDVEKEFGWKTYISFKDKIDAALIANKGEISIPLAMKSIKEGKSIGKDSGSAKGRNADFYCEVAWLGFKGSHYENAAFFMRDYDEMFGIISLMEENLPQDELSGLKSLLEVSTVPVDQVDWKLVMFCVLVCVVCLVCTRAQKTSSDDFSSTIKLYLHAQLTK